MTDKHLLPVALDLSKIRVLIIGGGRAATDKLKRLLRETTDIVIVSPELTDELLGLSGRYKLQVKKRAFELGDLKGAGLVVLTVSESGLNQRISELVLKKGLLLNNAAFPERGNINFCAYTKKDGITLAVSTSGQAPAVAARIRDYFAELLPDNTEELIHKIKELRTTIPAGKDREKLLRELSEEITTNLRD
ncbi:MAG: bifunctional precorrin-2 dehydrogenase/sirohydrochlorin ferrochelatase [Candidatus Dadabacteria bacterium]|nr:MAG: bifunctional precorrin-2 dehydrogenase/sirohydrochlorin ferrochelatase [Candidatus Dadabacteria bacterium]